MSGTFEPKTAIRTAGLGLTQGPPLDMQTIAFSVVWEHLRGMARGRRLPPKTDLTGRKRGIVIDEPVLTDVSLEISKGEVVCVRGSGSNELLRVLARRVPPTTGHLELHGTVADLVGVGETLNQVMTAVENIELHLALSGFRPADEAAYVDDIIDFAELERFRNVPVRRYSTGMRMRLSVALVMEGRPDILLLGDVLGVGDIGFQQRFVERLMSMRQEGCTMVLAMEDEELVRQLADRVLVFNEGVLVSHERPARGFLAKEGSSSADVTWDIAERLPENELVALRSVAVTRNFADQAADLIVRMEYEIKTAPLSCRPGIIVRLGRVTVFRSIFPKYLDFPSPRIANFSVAIPAGFFSEGDYAVATLFSCLDELKTLRTLKQSDAVTLHVKRTSVGMSSGDSAPILAPELPWQVERLQEGA